MTEQSIKLNKPKLDTDFMKALQTRASCREYDPEKELSKEQLSNLLWETTVKTR